MLITNTQFDPSFRTFPLPCLGRQGKELSFYQNVQIILLQILLWRQGMGDTPPLSQAS
jgi:hypothetical protein